MTDAQRMASVTNTSNLHWSGSHANNCGLYMLSNGLDRAHVRIYAPSEVEPGSSATHFDLALRPEVLMDPWYELSSDHRLTNHLLKDIGWDIFLPPCRMGRSP